MAAEKGVDTSEAEFQLERILASAVFEKAQRSQRFLRFLVNFALTEPNTSIKEYAVALDVFDRPADYDPSVDATVRVEASRLREYYEEEGRLDSVLISVPKGSYQATFSRRSSGAAIGSYSEPGAGAGSGKATDTRVTLAIVPFLNQTGDPGLGYIADGFADVLIRQLAPIPALKLIAHASVARYRDHAASPLTIGKSLGASNVFLGKLRGVGSRLSATTELCRVADQSVLHSEEYVFASDDLRLVHAQIQNDLLKFLEVEGSARNPGKRLGQLTTNATAYQEFLHGEQVARGGTPPDMMLALQHLDRAVALDPEFDLAWATIASAHALMGLYFDAPSKHMPAARAAAEMALRINPSLGEAYGILGIIDLVYDWNPAAARDKMATPGAQQAAVTTLACTIHLMERIGRPKTAENMLNRMLSYDPMSPSLIAEVGCLCYYRGHYEDALVAYQHSMGSTDYSPLPYWGLGKTLSVLERYEEAIEVVEQFQKKMGFEPPILSAEIGYAFGRLGKTTEARAIIRKLSDLSEHLYVDPYLFSIIFAALQEHDSTFHWLDKALEVRSPFLISLSTEPKWHSHRAMPAFVEFMRRIVPGSVS